jgi:LysR family transcriptional regulator for bpeEF and oprC
MERMLQAMEVFARIVECENFTRASNLLGIPKASASLLIQQLEVHL